MFEIMKHWYDAQTDWMHGAIWGVVAASWVWMVVILPIKNRIEARWQHGIG